MPQELDSYDGRVEPGKEDALGQPQLIVPILLAAEALCLDLLHTTLLHSGKYFPTVLIDYNR